MVGKFTTIEKLKGFEKIDKKCSAKYVPIYSSRIIKNLSPEYSFTIGQKYTASRSTHAIYLQNEDNDTIQIENSYDRSRAFSLRFVDSNITIPLDLNRVIHTGFNAQNLVENLLEDKDELNTALEHAKTTVRYLKDTKIPKSFKKKVLEVVFEDKQKLKTTKEIDITIASSYNTFYDYIDTVVGRYLEGQYLIVNQKGKTRKGLRLKNRFKRLDVTNKVYKLLVQENPEIFI